MLTTPNGLRYKIIQKGTGEKPKADDILNLNYVGKLIDGTEFDSSKKLGQPLSIQAKAGLPGWGEIIPMMPKGSKWEVYVPAKLAFGPEGNSKVPPSALVIYELELLDTK
ncbi:FKBP-type peptidyl-prolyl cis-trans isomerase [Cellvibrio sp.]|uniref:FKBP-type peptidyl-prolyl cis-trans isomerase n=1 Tax=Cellvibrio sp. TaxID=1965322 RepID=UPI003964890F